MRRLTPLEEDMPLPTVASVPAATALEADRGQLVDLRGSSDYRKAHVAGARWSIRPRLGRLALDPTQPVYLIGAPDVVALAAKDLRLDEGRGGEECVSTCRTRGSAVNKKK